MNSRQQSPPPPGFLRRRLLGPVLALLTQGVTPRKVAQTLALGTVCSLFPFLGTTALLNLLVGLRLRMNQPILQTLNQLLGPLHLLMIFAYVRLGEWLLGSAETAFSVGEMLRVFREESFSVFLQRFGLAGWQAFCAWALTAPLLYLLLALPLKKIFERLAPMIPPAPRPQPRLTTL